MRKIAKESRERIIPELSEERKQKLAEWDEIYQTQMKALRGNPIRELAISSGVYDCITDPYDKLDNGDHYSSVMPDLERFANLILDECMEVMRLVPYACDAQFGEEIKYQEAIRKQFAL